MTAPERANRKTARRNLLRAVAFPDEPEQVGLKAGAVVQRRPTRFRGCRSGAQAGKSSGWRTSARDAGCGSGKPFGLVRAGPDLG